MSSSIPPRSEVIEQLYQRITKRIELEVGKRHQVDVDVVRILDLLETRLARLEQRIASL